MLITVNPPSKHSGGKTFPSPCHRCGKQIMVVRGDTSIKICGKCRAK